VVRPRVLSPEPPDLEPPDRDPPDRERFSFVRRRLSSTSPVMSCCLAYSQTLASVSRRVSITRLNWAFWIVSFSLRVPPALGRSGVVVGAVGRPVPSPSAGAHC
jgi:hypothetical protein